MARRAAVALVLLLAAPLTARADITPANVASLAVKWDFAAGAVTGAAVLAGGRLLVPSWDGKVYALDPLTGTKLWEYAAGGPVVGAVLPTDDGGACFGTLIGRAVCLDAATGAERWNVDLIEPAPGSVWSALATANGRLFVSI